MCLEKKKGDLSVKGLSNLNRALLCKWSWRFDHDRDSLWRIVNGTKFGEDVGGQFTRDIRGSYIIGLWKEIRKDWETLLPKVGYTVGNGRRVQF